MENSAFEKDYSVEFCGASGGLLGHTVAEVDIYNESFLAGKLEISCRDVMNIDGKF